MERYIIYLATNTINKKQYIGRTEFSLEERRGDHIYDSSLEKPKYIFHKALKKHSYHNFHWCILDRSAKNLKELKELEKKYIAELDTMAPKGYNMTPGGDGVFPKGATKETHPGIASMALKRSLQNKTNHAGVRRGIEKRKGRNKTNHPGLARGAEKLRGRTKESHPQLTSKYKGKTKDTSPMHEKISISLKKRWEEKGHPSLGQKRTPETIEKLRLAATGVIKSPETILKLSKALKGKKRSDAAKENYRRSKLGSKHSEETKLKISETRKLKGIGKGQSNSNSATNKAKRKFKKEYPELFTFNKEIPPILPLEYTNNETLNIMN